MEKKFKLNAAMINKNRDIFITCDRTFTVDCLWTISIQPTISGQ